MEVTKKKNGDPVMLWGAFCWHGWGSLIPLEGTKITENQLKLIVTFIL